MTENEKPHLLIVEARYYEEFSDALLGGAQAAIDAAGATSEVVTVPGALEIPAAIAYAERAVAKGNRRFDGYVALGCVIRGETYHFEIVANESSRALTDLAVNHALAIGNGILTVENPDQARVRASADRGNKGGFAAEAALAMIDLRKRMAI